MGQLTTEQVINRVKVSLEQKTPLTLVRIGDGENIILAQDSVWPLNRLYKETWVKQAQKGKKGVSIPNIQLRDEMVKAIKKADIVGLLPENDQIIDAPDYLKRPLTEAVFKHFKINPETTCEATVMRECINNLKFWNLFKGKKVLVIYEHAKLWTSTLRKKYGVNVTMAIPFTHYKQMSSCLDIIQKSAHKFDVVLLACGVNSVVLAHEIVKRTGKIAIDFGKPAKFMSSVN
ncbi:GT-D fold domain-containing glycosyltransferase [Alteribacillus sp. JSM 102045]|uniref:GT-D fold domain-containing glycosyltransferase n=1 Tax=Alteribacillus sp. JSM 102045 TaxID=1562101 RepID=UPI0035C26328